MAHTTLPVLHSQDFPQVFQDGIERLMQLTTAIYDKHVPSADFSVENHGSIFLLRPLSEYAEVWVREFLPDVTWFGSAVAIEHRYIDGILDVIAEEGLAVKHG